MSAEYNNHDLFQQMDEAIAGRLEQDAHEEAGEILLEQRKSEIVEATLVRFTQEYPQYNTLVAILATHEVSLEDLIGGLLRVDNEFADGTLLEILLAIDLIGDAAVFEDMLAAKTEVQVKILTSDRLTTKQKHLLIAIADDTLPGDGIDMSDPDSVAQALHKKYTQEQRHQKSIDRIAKIYELFDEEFSKYDIDVNDPEYDSIKLLATLRLCFGASIQPEGFTTILSNVHLIGISKDDFMRSIHAIAVHIPPMDH